MWAYLMKKWPEFAKFFFGDLSDEDLKRSDWASCISRETGHMDIRVNLSEDRVFVVENKIKSTPTLAQLNDYKTDLKGAFCDGVLTGIIEPIFKLDGSGWHFLSYEEIANKIAELNVEKDPIIESYVKDIRAINNLLRAIIMQNGERFPLRGDLANLVGDVSLGDVCQKLLCSNLVNYLKKNVKVAVPEGYELAIRQYYARGGGGLDCHFVKAQGAPEETAIGVSLEGHSFRRILIKRDGFTLSKVLIRGKEVLWFAPNKSKGKIAFPGDKVKERTSGMRDEKCTYEGPASDHYFMVYQYWKIGADGMSFADLADEISDTLVYAKTVIDDHPDL